MGVETIVKFVDLARQYQTIKADVDSAIARVLARTDFILGDDVQRFEEEFAHYCEAKYAVGVDNGTAALEMALRAVGIGPGDEVLVPVNTFMASASAVSFTGATPIFVDIDPATYNIDVQQIERRITPRTRAIMPVHLYGQPAEMDAIMSLAERYHLYVVEDACQAHGARYKDRAVGGIGHVAAFSFYPGKNLGAYGDAGAVVTNDPEITERIKIMRNCGQREKYNHVTLAYNHRLDTLQAAVLRVKLRHLDEWNAARRDWACLYDQLLADVGVVTPSTLPDVAHVYHLYVIQASERSYLQAYMTGQGFATGIHYPTPLHLQPAYKQLNYHAGDFPVAEKCAPLILSLPMFAELQAQEVEAVVDCVRSFYRGRPDARSLQNGHDRHGMAGIVKTGDQTPGVSGERSVRTTPGV